MLTPRSGHTATLLENGNVLIAGGMVKNREFLRDCELFEPQTGRFTRTGSMAVARVGQAAVSLGRGRILIAGGWISSTGVTDAAEVYDERTGSFTTIAPMRERRARSLATRLRDGSVLITGGASCDGPRCSLPTAELFDPGSMRWSALPPMRHARIAHTATLLPDGRVLIAGGSDRDGHVSASAELYDPVKRTFSETSAMAVARYKHTAGLMADGRVLIAGGSDDRDWQGTMSSTELFDAALGRFLPGPALNSKRFKLPATAVSLADGRVLIAGGAPALELLDATGRSFLPVPGSLAEPRHYMSATRLLSGDVLLAGGYPNNDQATAETWFYRR
jgi:hypothetical protein